MLAAETQAEILSLFYRDKRKVRAIAREVGVNRKAVRRVLKRKSVVTELQSQLRVSILDSFKPEIDKLMVRDRLIMATAALNHLRSLGYSGGITVVRDYMRKKRALIVRPKEAFLRLEFNPAEVAQVDWGEFGNVFGDGIKIHCFAMVLGYSRLVYIEFTKSEKFEDFLRCHENAFRFYGGVPRECWYDNLTSAVTERVGQLIKFNAKFMAYMGHHTIRPHACNVARGNEKGRVEDLIKYVRMNFWPAREFKSLADLNQQAWAWRDEVCNQREHRSTKQIPRLHFERDEKSLLLPLNKHRYDTDEIVSRVVPNDFHIIYETNRYSVPWTLCGIAVTVRINSNVVRVFYDDRIVTEHPRSYFKHKVFTKQEHQQGLLDRKPGATRDAWQVAAVKSIGPKMVEYVNLLRSGERSLRSELSRILALATVYGEVAVHDACAELLSRNIIGVAALEVSLKASHHPSRSRLNPEPINFENEKLNRLVPAVDLRRYDALLLEHSTNIKSASGETDSGNNGDDIEGCDGDDGKKKGTT